MFIEQHIAIAYFQCSLRNKCGVLFCTLLMLALEVLFFCCESKEKNQLTWGMIGAGTRASNLYFNSPKPYVFAESK